MRFLSFVGRVLRAAIFLAAAVIPVLLIDATGIAGATLITYGGWLVYRPAGFIIAGIFMLVLAILLAPRRKP